MSIPALSAMMGGLSIFGIVAMLGGLIGASYMQPVHMTEYVNGVPIYKTQNTPLRLGLFGLGVMGLGLTGAPLFAMATAISPSIMPTALGLTTAIFGGASLMAYNMPKGKMLGYGGALGGALLGLIGLQVVGLLTSLIMGPNPLSMMLFNANNYIGIGLFSIFIAYDTHVAIRGY
jgi:FtsH-binding integral membrane protein